MIMIMKDGGRQKFDRIVRYPFFQAVGEPLPASVIGVRTWKQAKKASATKRWEVCTLMARNALQRFLEERCWSRTQDWNPLADELRPQVVDFVAGLLPKTSMPNEISKEIRNHVTWDLLAICIEHEFIDVVEPPFYVPLLDPWYAAGHFPCGWDGRALPVRWDGVIREGKLIVY